MTDTRFRSAEFRAVADSEGVVEGYFTTWGTEYDIGGGLRERVARGAFDASQPIPVYLQHQHAAGPIGVSRNLAEDDHGLRGEVELFLDDPRARSVWRAMQAGALREWSVGFRASSEDIDVSTRGLEVINRGDLMETSVVLRGANHDTETLAVRAAEDERKREDDGEVEKPCPNCGYAPKDGADPAGDVATDQMQLGERTAELLDRIDEPLVRELLREIAAKQSSGI